MSLNDMFKLDMTAARLASDAEARAAEGSFAAPAGSAMWMCPVCNYVMTEEQSKGYRGCPPTGAMHFAQHVPVELVPCPDCYGGHFRPCQTCSDTGMATRLLPITGTTPLTIIVDIPFILSQ